MSTNKTNIDIRAENTSRVIRMLYEHEKLTKPMLASNLGLSQPTINTIVEELRSTGLVYQHAASVSSGGRIPLVINFNYSSFFAVGCEITAKAYNIVLIDLRGLAIEYNSGIKDFSNSPEYWTFLSECIRELVSNNSIPDSSIIGIGITLPGIINHDMDMLEHAPTLGVNDFHLSGITKYFNYPLFFENEANAAGFSEIWTRPNLNDACYISINEGVGGALIRDRKIIYGNNFHEGEYGHMVLIPYGKKCNCGKNGCFEAYCSLSVLSNACHGSTKHFFMELPNNKELQKLWNEYLDNLAIGISNIQLALDLPIVLGGKLASYLDPYFHSLCSKIDDLYPFSASLSSSLTLGRYKKDSCAIGVALMMVAKKLSI